jgi:N-acetylmuramoyl-L-alanine amidase
MSQRRFHLICLLLAAVFFTAKAPAQGVSLSGDLLGQKVVVLDPGHGGHDPGAVGPSGLAEKDVALALAKKIKETLAGTYAVYLTRDGDYGLDIERRTAVANQHGADVFISLHTGGSLHHNAQGMAIFYYGPGADQGLYPESVAPLGNGGQTADSWDRVQLKHAVQSKRLADLLKDALVAGPNPRDRGIQRAPCMVLEGADMPAVLVEFGYISHPGEEKAFKDPEAMSAIGEAISRGIRAFFR